MNEPEDISPADASALKDRGAQIVDIREPGEWATGVIPGAAFAPLSGLDAYSLEAPNDNAVIFHCKGGARTRANAAALKAKANGRACYLLAGGIDGWRAAGLPIAQPT
jgi:rhodanese-related sulfurtransferase